MFLLETILYFNIFLDILNYCQYLFFWTVEKEDMLLILQTSESYKHQTIFLAAPYKMVPGIFCNRNNLNNLKEK